MRKAAVIGYLQLMRPPNLPTAAADILAGAALAGIFGDLPGTSPAYSAAGAVLILVMASVLLYAGGVVLNDVFDAELDARERPERPIPRGAVSRNAAGYFGGALLVAGTVLAALVREQCGYVAVLLAGAILFYNAYAKRSGMLGPLVMGACRSLNLWLGISVLPMTGEGRYLWIPLLYIFAVTTVSRGEVHGDNKKALLAAALMYAIVIFGVGILALGETTRFWMALPFLALLGIMVYRPLVRAYQHNEPQEIRRAVIGGVLGIVALDAAWAAAYGGLLPAILILALLPLSRLLAARFAVT